MVQSDHYSKMKGILQMLKHSAVSALPSLWLEHGVVARVQCANATSHMNTEEFMNQYYKHQYTILTIQIKVILKLTNKKCTVQLLIPCLPNTSILVIGEETPYGRVSHSTWRLQQVTEQWWWTTKQAQAWRFQEAHLSVLGPF